MFQPFSQENPLQTGTGLGLAIVNSIVKSEGMRGKVDVDSTEGVGTEIRVVIEANSPSKSGNVHNPEANSLVHSSLPKAIPYLQAFEMTHAGQRLLRKVLSSYITDWWGARIVEDEAQANIIVLNEDFGIIVDLLRQQDVSRPIILLTSSRGNHEITNIVQSFQDIGGDCFVLNKPIRPSYLFKALQHACEAFQRSPNDSRRQLSPSSLRWRPALSQRSSLLSENSQSNSQPNGDEHAGVKTVYDYNEAARTSSLRTPITRRYSEEIPILARRPPLPRTKTYGTTISSMRRSPSMTMLSDGEHTPPSNTEAVPLVNGNSHNRSPPNSIIIPRSTPLALSDSGSTPAGEMLPSAMGALNVRESKTIRVLIVEDNNVNRALLAQWLTKQVRRTSQTDLHALVNANLAH
jgi:CheY-like chemotaxis protein